MTDPLLNPSSTEASKLAEARAAVRQSRRGRIVVAGPEGAGKNTLVRSILATDCPEEPER